MKKPKSIKKMTSLVMALCILIQLSILSTITVNAKLDRPTYKSTIFSEEFSANTSAPSSVFPGVSIDAYNQTGPITTDAKYTTGSLSVSQDPLDASGYALKVTNAFAQRQSVYIAPTGGIPLDIENPTYVEFDFYSPNAQKGNFYFALGGDDNWEVPNASSILFKWGGANEIYVSNVYVAGIGKETATYNHIAAKLELLEDKSTVKVTFDVKNHAAWSATTTISNLTTDGANLLGLRVCFGHETNLTAAHDWYIDNINIYNEAVIDDAFKNATVWSGHDAATQISSPDISFVNDTSSENRGLVLKLAPKEVNVYNSVRLKADGIPVSDTVPTWIEYDYYTPAGYNGMHMAQFFDKNGAYSFCPVYNITNDDTVYYYKDNATFFSGGFTKNYGGWTHAKIKLLRQKGSNNVTISAAHLGKVYSFVTDKLLNDNSTVINGIGIGLRSKNAALDPSEDYMYIDNFEVYQEEATASLAPDYGNIVYSDNFDYVLDETQYSSLVGHIGTGSWTHSAVSTPDIAVVDDPSPENRGRVLKLKTTNTDTKPDVIRFADKSIPISATVPTWIEYDYYAPGNGRVIANLVKTTNAFTFNPVFLHHQNSGEYYYRDFVTYWTGVDAKKDGYTHVRIKLLRESETSNNVIVTTEHLGNKGHTFVQDLGATAANVLRGIMIGVSNEIGTATISDNDYICIDNFAVWTEGKIEPTQYATENGVIAEETFEDYLVSNCSKLENKGTGWIEAWQGEQAIVASATEAGMKQGNALDLRTRTYVNAYGPELKRHFTKAINLKTPGIYELSADIYSNDGTANGKEIRLYFGSNNFYMNLKNTSDKEQILFPGLTMGTSYEQSTRAMHSNSMTVKLKVVVLDENGNGRVFAKAYNTNGKEQLSWDYITDVKNLTETIGTDYLNWVGFTSGSGVAASTYFDNIKVVKTDGTLDRYSYSLTSAGKTVSEFADITTDLKVNASFINTSEDDETVQAFIALYAGGKLVDVVAGTAIPVPADTSTPVSISELGFNSITKQFDECRVFFWNTDMNIIADQTILVTESES